MDEEKTSNIAFLARHTADGQRSSRPAIAKAQRKTAKKARRIEQDEKDVDMDINRALDAIALLAQNKMSRPLSSYGCPQSNRKKFLTTSKMH